MKRICLSTALIVLLLSVNAQALDYRDARQTAGIYVSMNGRMHSVFGDFPALGYVEGEAQEVPFSLNSDVQLWVEGNRVAPGKKNWTFRVDAEGAWTLGEKNAEDDAARFRIPHRESGTLVPCLTSSFHLDPGANAVALRFSYGKRSGEILLRLDRTEARSTLALANLDLVRARRHLVRLREIAGVLEAEQSKRPAWSGILADLGTAMTRAGDDVHLTELTFTEGKKDITLTVTGQASGGQEAADGIAAALRAGSTSRILPELSRPVARMAEGGGTWNFEITATAPLSKWHSIAKIDELSDGRDRSAVAIELLLLESRLLEATAASPLSIADIQPRLLAAKRSAGVMLSNISASTRTEDQGLVRFPVRLRVGGDGAAVVSFLRNLEDYGAPLTLVPERMIAGIHSCELDLTVVFYDYVTLAKREPVVNGVIAPLKLRAGFRDKVDLYLQGIGTGKPAPFIAPRWSRDPFVLSGE